MSAATIAQARTRALLLRNSNQMVLRRRTARADIDVTLAVKMAGFVESDINNTTIQGMSKAVITDDEIVAAGWPGPPKEGDWIVYNNQMLKITSVETRRQGDIVIKHLLEVSGNAT